MEYLSTNLIDPDQIVIYTKWITLGDYQEEYRKICLLDGDRCHMYRGFNQFTIETYPIPLKIDGWISMFEVITDEYVNLEDTLSENVLNKKRKWIRKNVCDPTVSQFIPMFDPHSIHSESKMYKTLDNYGIGFIVFLDLNIAHVYARTTDWIGPDLVDDSRIFVNLVKSFEFEEIFIGRSDLNEMTEFSGGHGSKWDGNSILLRISNLSYVYIGTTVTEFETDELIVSYMSSVGNNCVCYPYAESENYCYCMNTMARTNVADHPDRVFTGSVSYVENIDYVDMVHRQIAGRDSVNYISGTSPNEKTNSVRFLEEKQMFIVENTCTDEDLPIVQHLNDIF